MYFECFFVYNIYWSYARYSIKTAHSILFRFFFSSGILLKSFISQCSYLCYFLLLRMNDSKHIVKASCFFVIISSSSSFFLFSTVSHSLLCALLFSIRTIFLLKFVAKIHNFIVMIVPICHYIHSAIYSFTVSQWNHPFSVSLKSAPQKKMCNVLNCFVPFACA